MTQVGIVSNGEVWKFLKMQGTKVTVDTDDSFLNQPDKIIGIVLSMLRSLE